MIILCNNTCIDSKLDARLLQIDSGIRLGRRTILSGRLLASVILSILSLFCISTLSAQTDFYNENFVKLTDLGEIKAFVSEMKEHCLAERYRINKTPVVEYFDKEDKSFKGMSINSDLVSIEKIKIIKKNKDLKKFIKIHGIETGSALYFKRPVAGMTLGHLKLIAGEPDKIKYSIDGDSQIITLKYLNGSEYSFKDGKLLKSIGQVNKTPIALKQP